MSEYQLYRKKALQLMRPYVFGEDMTGISVSDEDKEEVETIGGGMIAKSGDNPNDKWYVAAAFVRDNYEKVS